MSQAIERAVIILFHIRSTKPDEHVVRLRMY